MKANSEPKSMAPTAIHAHQYMTNSWRAWRPPTRALPLHRVEEVRVGFRVLHLVEQELDRGQLVHGMQELAQNPHLGQLRGIRDELFLARARAVDVDRRAGAFLGDAAIQMDFRIAGALELFEYDVVHLRARIDQRGGENGEASALFDVARAPKNRFGRFM